MTDARIELVVWDRKKIIPNLATKSIIKEMNHSNKLFSGE